MDRAELECQGAHLLSVLLPVEKRQCNYWICLSIRSIAEKVVEGLSWSFCFWKDVLHQQEQLMTFWYEVEVILFHHCFNDHFLPSTSADNV